MPIDELKELGLKLKATRKEKGLTQQELSDISHVSTKQIANDGHVQSFDEYG